jgi:uncharacterized protein (DUF1015 family)
MATLHPFRGVRPVPEKVENVACVPYDVIDTEEARALAAGNPDSFLHVIRPEIDLPTTVDEHDSEVYQKGAENLRRFVDSDSSVQEDRPSLYIYRLEMLGRTQTGLFGCVSVKEYDNDSILKHEKTRPTKEEDRMKHILSQRAHSEPVMLTYRGIDAINHLVAEEVGKTPVYDFDADDGVRHTLWKVDDAEAFSESFEQVDLLYIADGHHRCKAASRAADVLRTSTQTGIEPAPGPEFEFFPAVIFPLEEMKILPYNRIVKQLPVTPDAFLDTLRTKFDIKVDSGETRPTRPGTVCLYLSGRWHTLELPEPDNDTIAQELDASRLSEHFLEPELGISDPRRDPNLDFVGGIRGTAELERLVDEQKAELAISMFPTSIEELIAVSDAGLLMPPKSTWFEPKLRSGLLIHLFD